MLVEIDWKAGSADNFLERSTILVYNGSKLLQATQFVMPPSHNPILSVNNVPQYAEINLEALKHCNVRHLEIFTEAPESWPQNCFVAPNKQRLIYVEVRRRKKKVYNFLLFFLSCVQAAPAWPPRRTRFEPSQRKRGGGDIAGRCPGD